MPQRGESPPELVSPVGDGGHSRFRPASNSLRERKRRTASIPIAGRNLTQDKASPKANCLCAGSNSICDRAGSIAQLHDSKGSQMKVPPLLAASVAAVPLSVINLVIRLLFSRLLKQHPDLFDRLGEHLEKRYGFVPTDLPFAFVVDPAKPMIMAERKPAVLLANAVVEGPLFLLLALLEGRGDADALFFSRDLAVTGDMEAMMALRNALEDCNVDLPIDLSAAAGPLRPVFMRVTNFVRDRALAGESVWN